MQGKIGQNSKVIHIQGGKDMNATALTAEWINLKNCEKVRWIISCGVLNASSSAAVTLTQSLSDGGTPVALNLDTYDSISGETVTATAVTSDTFNIVTGHSNTTIVIEVKASDLTRSNLGSTSYDWVTLNIASPGSYSTIYSVTAEVFGLKYGPSATVLA